MSQLLDAVDLVLCRPKEAGKPLAVVLAGHNGSGKSTMWYKKGLADKLQIPLINADRMMLSILPEATPEKPLPQWAVQLRDTNEGWMGVAQKGVQAFVSQAMLGSVSFAMETVFSHWQERDDGTYESKIDLIHELQAAGYFVLLFFVGLADSNLSVSRVLTRVASGGHNVEYTKLLERFPRTQKAIRHAVGVADAAILTDNSRSPTDAFTVCRVQIGEQQPFDCRDGKKHRLAKYWNGSTSSAHGSGD